MQVSGNYNRVLFDKTVIGLVLCRMNGDLVDVNTAYADLLGRSIEETLGLTYWQITPEKYLSQEKTQLESLEKAGGYGPYEKEYIHADGHFVPVRLSGQIVEIDGEKYIWSIVEDITDRKKADEAQKDAAASQNAIFTAIPDPMFELNDCGRYLNVWANNPDELAASKERLLGRTVSEILPANAAERVMTALKEAGEKGQSHGQQIQLDTPGGNMWFELSVSLKERDVSPHHFIVLSRNITEHKQKEKEKEELVQSLHIALEQTQQASKAKSLFLASMSHEIRTPMNGIFGMLQVLRTTALNEEQLHYIETLDSCSKNLLLLIDDLLDLSKIESGKLVLNIEPFEIFDWVTNIQNIAEPFFESKKTVFITEVSNDLPARLEGDAQRLLQIVSNLLNNAAKYTQNGEVKITVGGQLITENQFNLHISIRDTGIGIADDKLEFIFDDFHQIEFDRTMNKGVGLGLAICKRLTNIMGGSLQVISELGKGSCFTFSTKLSIPKESICLKDTEEQPEINRKLSILLVDDDLVNRLLARRLLENEGHSVIEAENGQVAIEKAKSGFFDVILMDVHMPIMNGVSSTRIIREGSTKGKQVPIIGLTASVMNNEKDLYRKAGMNAVVEKPILMEKLMKTIQQLL